MASSPPGRGDGQVTSKSAAGGPPWFLAMLILIHVVLRGHAGSLGPSATEYKVTGSLPPSLPALPQAGFPLQGIPQVYVAMSSRATRQNVVKYF